MERRKTLEELWKELHPEKKTKKRECDFTECCENREEDDDEEYY